MKPTLLFLFFIILIGFITINTGCKTTNKDNNKQEFYYYPQKNLYYDVAKSTYLYSLDGGKTWNSIKSLANEDKASLGKKEIIYTDNDSVWINNAAHRKLYFGNAFNIPDEDTSTVAAATEVTEKKMAKTNSRHRVARTSHYEHEKKQPVKGFFRRLFGKHKKEK